MGAGGAERPEEESGRGVVSRGPSGRAAAPWRGAAERRTKRAHRAVPAPAGPPDPGRRLRLAAGPLRRLPALPVWGRRPWRRARRLSRGRGGAGAGSALPFAQRGRSQAAGGGRVTPLHNEPPRQGEITPGLPFRRAAPTHSAWGRAPGLCRGRREHGDVRPVSPALGGLKGRSFPQEKVPVARPVPMSRAGRQAGAHPGEKL